MRSSSKQHRKQICDSNSPQYMVEIERKINAAHRCRDRSQQIKMFNEALTFLEGYLNPSKKTIHDLLALAELNWEITEPKKAIAYLKEAIQIAPKDSRSFILLGKYLLNKGLKAQALTFLDRAIQLDPSDIYTPKIRERAARQQQRNYTVVGNLNDLEKKSSAEQSKRARKKSEATRLLNINDINGAAAVLEQVDQNTVVSVDSALASLLGHQYNLASADQLQKKHIPKSAISIFSLISTLLIVCIASLAGVLFSAYFSEEKELRYSMSIETHLKGHQHSLLLTALDELGGEDEPRHHLQVLANILLYTFHGQNKDFLIEAEYLYDEMSDEQKSRAEVWYAQQLLLREYKKDQRIRKRSNLLKKQRDESAAQKQVAMSHLYQDSFKLAKKLEGLDALSENSYYLLMTLAESAAQKGLNEKCKIILHRVIVMEKKLRTPIFALSVLAGIYAQEGDYLSAKALLSQVIAARPQHILSHVMLLSLTYLLEPPLEEKPEGGEPSLFNQQLKVAKELNAKNGLESVDMIPLKVSLAAFSQMNNEYKTFENLLYQAIGNKEESPTLHNPVLLEIISSMYILDFSAKKAIALLENQEASEQLDQHISLLKNLTRAKVLNGLRVESPSNYTQLITDSRKNKALEDSILLRTGQLKFDFHRSPIPFKFTFSSLYFPELEIANISSSQADLKEVRQSFERISMLKLAQMALSLNRNEAAKEYLNEIRWSAENNPQFLLTDALLMIHQNERRDARTSIERAVNFAPDDPIILLAAARIQFDTGNLRSAMLYIEKIATEKYKSPDIDALRARILIKQGQFESADKDLQASLKKSPKSTALLSAYILLKCQQDNMLYALQKAKILADYLPEDLGVYLLNEPVVASFVLYQKFQKGSKKAKDQLLDILEKNPQQPSVSYFLALLEKNKKQKKMYLKTAKSLKGCASFAARVELKTPGKSVKISSSNSRKRRR